MGEKNRRAKKKNAFLAKHPYCIYCGDIATTTDHCPPRCFFIERRWPEGYEFPCCEACNAESRVTEQTLAALIRSQAAGILPEERYDEWLKIIEGINNNHPEIIRDWHITSASENKRMLRDIFGKSGDMLRHDGWHMINVGERNHKYDL